jgi:uncharacterized protein (DUF58 family)
VALYVVGLMWGYPVLRALAGVAGAAIVVALLSTLTRLRASVVREVYPQRVERDRPAIATLTVRNPTAGRQHAFTATDVIDSHHQPVAVRALPAGGAATYRYALPTERRGRVLVGPLTVRRADPLGLARRDTPVGGTTVLWVHPRRHPARAATGARTRHHHEGPVPRLPLAGSMEQRAVREYVPGDEQRHLHWRATARVQKLMVRDYVDPAQPRCVVLLDTRSAALNRDAFEQAVEVAASVAYAAVEHGHPTRLCTTTGLDIGVEGNLAGGRILLDALCEVEQSPRRDPASVEHLTSGLRSGGWLVFVTGGAGLASAGTVTALRRYYTPLVVFDLGDRQSPDAVADAAVVRAPDAAGAIRRWNGMVAR